MKSLKPSMILSFFELSGCPVCSISYGKKGHRYQSSLQTKQELKGKKMSSVSHWAMGPIPVMCTCQHLMEIGTTFCWLLQKIEAAGSGTVPAAVVPWKADGQTAAQRPRAKQSKPASSFPLPPPRSPRCNPWDFSFPVLPFDAAALALFCFACPQMSQLVPA